MPFRLKPQAKILNESFVYLRKCQLVLTNMSYRFAIIVEKHQSITVRGNGIFAKTPLKRKKFEKEHLNIIRKIRFIHRISPPELHGQ